MGLTSEQIQHYQEEGYLILEALIHGAAWERSMGVFRELVERSRSMTTSDGAFNLAPDSEGKPIPGRLHKIQGVCVAEERVLNLAREPVILDCVEDLIGPNIDVFGTKFFPMPGHQSTSTGWHQDNHYFGTNSDRVVSCAIYLEATDRESGCLQVVPRSHRSGALVAHAPGQGEWAHGSWAQVEESEAVDIVCPAGTVVLFSANLLHGAHPNRSDRSSYRTAWHYIPGDLDLEQFPRGGYRDRHILRETP
ncbi:MAG TPA: phytanoyl-CoA dioxygenase family protein [Chthonomonadaceae bacterium]|nr:phytanoyl-CoA dioxygenase family protein [Chthonomonadaceae bacterium]